MRIHGRPITGAHFRHICQYGDSEPDWWFNADIIYACLQLVKDRLPRIRLISAVATSKILYGNLAGAVCEFHGRDGAKHIRLYDWIIVMFNITNPRGNGMHWTLGDCFLTDRVVSYYDCMRQYSHRTQHIQAMACFLEFAATSPTPPDDRPWQCVERGTEDMAVQDNSYDCGPSVLIMADAISSGILLTVLKNAVVERSRLHIASCLLLTTSVDLRNFLTAEVRPGVIHARQ